MSVRESLNVCVTARPAAMGAGVSASSASPPSPHWTGHWSFKRAALWVMRKGLHDVEACQLLSWWWSAAMGICVTWTSPCSHRWKVRCLRYNRVWNPNLCRIFIIIKLGHNAILGAHIPPSIHICSKCPTYPNICWHAMTGNHATPSNIITSQYNHHKST